MERYRVVAAAEGIARNNLVDSVASSVVSAPPPSDIDDPAMCNAAADVANPEDELLVGLAADDKSVAAALSDLAARVAALSEQAKSLLKGVYTYANSCGQQFCKVSSLQAEGLPAETNWREIAAMLPRPPPAPPIWHFYANIATL
jgi:hypothetical protein